MNKTAAIIFISVAAFHTAIAQIPNWSWAKSGRGQGHDYAMGISTDANGNNYVTGYFQPPMVIFDTDTLYATASANSNLFVARYDSSGNVIWAKAASGNAQSFGTGIKQDTNGNCVVTGYYYSNVAITFGTITLAPTTGITIVSAFIVKYDTAGNVMWAKNAGPSSWGQNNFSIDLDAAGNAYLTGTFDDSTYLEKYDSAGNLLWKKYNSGNSNTTHSWSINTNASGDNFISGYFSSPALAFGSFTLNNTSNGHEIFVVKSDSAGNVIWATSDGVYPSLYKPSVSSDATGNCYITGYFNGSTAMFGSTTLFNAGFNDIFVVKYDTIGNVIWAKRAGGNNYDLGIGIRTDANGNSYVTGFFRGGATFGSFTLFSANDPEIFIAKYDAAGTVLWAKSAGGSDVDNSNGVGIDASGNCYVAGNFFSAYPYFDNLLLVNSNLSFNPSEVFVAKLGSGITTAINPASHITNAEGVSIYPNPANDAVIIRCSQFPAEIVIYDLLGKNILSEPLTVTNHQLKTTHLSPGIYFYEVKNKDSVIGKGKVIKE